MHQIRAHFAAIGHPLLGDALYGGDCTRLTRQALHCCAVALFQPVTGERLAFSSELPEDLKSVLPLKFSDTLLASVAQILQINVAPSDTHVPL
jgi:hypothetical protein